MGSRLPEPVSPQRLACGGTMLTSLTPRERGGSATQTPRRLTGAFASAQEASRLSADSTRLRSVVGHIGGSDARRNDP